MPSTPDFKQAALAWTLPWDIDWVTAVSFVGDSRRLVAGNNRGDILYWELPELRGNPAPAPVRWLQGHQNSITRLQSTTDGRTLISASYDHSIRYWDLNAKPGGKGSVVLNAGAIGDHEAAKGRGRGRDAAPPPVQAELELHKAVRVLDAHQEWVSTLALGQDNQLLLSGDDAGTVIVWDRPTARQRQRWKVKGWVHAGAIAPDNRQAAISERIPLYADPNTHYGMKLWNVERGEVDHDLAKTIKSANQPLSISAAAYSLEGNLLALGVGGASNGSGGGLFLVDPKTGNKVRDLAPAHKYGLTDLAFHPDGKHLASSGRDTLVSIWSLADGKLVKQLGQSRGTSNGWDWIHAISFSPDGQWLAAADMGGQVQVWSLNG